MYDLEAVREDARNAVLAHYKVANIVSGAINAGRGILNAGRAGMKAFSAFKAPAEAVVEGAAKAPGAIGTAFNAFRGAGGLHHAANIGMGAGAVAGTGYLGARAVGAGLRDSGAVGQQPPQYR